MSRSSSARSRPANSATATETGVSRDEGALPRPTQDRTQPRSFPAALKELFGKLAEAVTGKLTPTAARRRKRREETGRAFRMAAQKISRATARVPAAAYAAAVFLSATLDWLNPWHHGTTDDFEQTIQHTPQTDLYPHL